MVNPIPLLMILHLHRFPYSHRGNLDECPVLAGVYSLLKEKDR